MDDTTLGRAHQPYEGGDSSPEQSVSSQSIRPMDQEDIERLVYSAEEAKRDRANILRVWQKGEEYRDLWDNFYLHYGPGIEKFIRNWLNKYGLQDQVEDVKQETFCRALRSVPTYIAQPDIPFKPWLYGFAKNICLEICRKSKQDTQQGLHHLSQLPESLDPPTRDASEKALDKALIKQVLEKEPAENQYIFYLVYQGLSYKEIAALIGKSSEAVKETNYRIRKKIRELGRE